MFKTLCIAFVFLTLVVSCVKKPIVAVSDTATENLILSLDAPSAIPAEFSSERYMFVKELNTIDKAVFFYQDNEGYMHYFNGKEDRIINKEVMDKYKKIGGVPMSMSYAYDGKYVYFSQPVRWGPKKVIFIKLEQDGKVVYTKELSASQYALKPASVAFDGKGGMLLTWIDESPPHYIKGAYTLVKDDNFPDREELISFEQYAVPAVRPAYTDKGFALVYVMTKIGGEGEIKARFLSDGSEKTLYSGKVFDFDFLEEKDGFLIRLYQESPDMKLMTFNKSFDRIKEYSIQKPAELGDAFTLYTNISLIQGEPFIFGGGSPPSNIEVSGFYLPQKPNIFYSYAGKDFERVVGGKPYMFTSSTPFVDSSGKLTVAAYTDMRFVNPTVMLAVFDSDGKIVKRDIALLEKPGVDTGSPRVAHLGGDIFRVFYPVKDKEKNVWIYRAKDINAGSIQSLYGTLPSKDREGLLKETISKFTECRKNNDYGCIYDMLDPTYKSGTSKEKHIDMMKSVGAAIIDYRIENCSILEESVLAACDAYIKAELPREILGKPIKETQRTVEQYIKGDLWIYIDGKWRQAVPLPMLGYAQQW